MNPKRTALASAMTLLAVGGAALAQFGGGPGGLPARPGVRLPFAAGTVTAIDTTANTITITPQSGGQTSQTLTVADGAQITAQIAGQVSDLKIGDLVQVRGLPTTIEATQIVEQGSGDLSGVPSTPSGAFGGGALGGGRLGGGQAPPVFAQATGRVFNTNPLTLSVSDNVFVTVRLEPKAKVTKSVTETLADIKVGDKIMAGGQNGGDGTFTATRIGVNMGQGRAGKGQGDL